MSIDKRYTPTLPTEGFYRLKAVDTIGNIVKD